MKPNQRIRGPGVMVFNDQNNLMPAAIKIPPLSQQPFIGRITFDTSLPACECLRRIGLIEIKQADNFYALKITYNFSTESYQIPRHNLVQLEVHLEKGKWEKRFRIHNGKLTLKNGAKA